MGIYTFMTNLVRKLHILFIKSFCFLLYIVSNQTLCGIRAFFSFSNSRSNMLRIFTVDLWIFITGFYVNKLCLGANFIFWLINNIG